MDTLKKIMFPKGKWRQTFATLIVNLMSVHLGVILGDFMTKSKVELKLFMFKDMYMNETEPPPICESRLEYEREFVREHIRDGFMDLFNISDAMVNVTKQIISEYNHKYISDEGVYAAEWMQRILVFCYGAVMPLAMYIGHRFGIKKALSVSAMLFVIACLPCDAVNISREIPSIGAVMVFGVACAFQVYNVLLYVHDISSWNRMGIHMFLQPLLIVTGLYFNTVKPDLTKTFMTIIFNPLVPVLFLIGLQILPESPIWLQEQEKSSEVERASDWFQIKGEPSTELEAVELPEKSTDIDSTDDDSDESFIDLLKVMEEKRQLALWIILVSAYWIMACCILIRMVNEKVDNWISDLAWILLITVLTCPSATIFMISSKPQGRKLLNDRQEFIFDCIFLITLFCFVDGQLLVFKKMNTPIFTINTILQSVLYSCMLGSSLPRMFVKILIPDNVTAGVYVFFSIVSWTITWVLAETWWWLRLTTDITYWFLIYVGFLVFLLVYVYFFIKNPEQPKKPKECKNCNKKRLSEAEETVVCTTVSNEKILSDTKEETIPCSKDLENILSNTKEETMACTKDLENILSNTKKVTFHCTKNLVVK